MNHNLQARLRAVERTPPKLTNPQTDHALRAMRERAVAARGVTVINGRYVQPARDLGPALPRMPSVVAEYLRDAHRSD